MEQTYGELIKEFYGLYRRLKKENHLRMHSHFDISGEGTVEIWERDGRKERQICKITEETEEECYRKALRMLKDYAEKVA